MRRNTTVWRRELIAELGGERKVTLPERMLIDVAVETWWHLRQMNRKLSRMPSVMTQRRSAVPAVMQSVKLSTLLGSTLQQLGLPKKKRPASDPDVAQPTVTDFLREWNEKKPAAVTLMRELADAQGDPSLDPVGDGSDIRESDGEQ